MPFSDLLKQLTQQAKGLNVTLAQKSTDDVKAFFTGLASLRVVFVNASGFGHQASTLIAMQRAIQLGYTGTIDVFYEEVEGDYVAKRLELLIPGFVFGTTVTMQYMGVTLNFETAEIDRDKPELDTKAFGLTGGMDPSQYIANPADYFSTNIFMQLQPPGWEAKSTADGNPALNMLWHAEVADGTRLTSIAQLGGAYFDGFAFNMLDPVLTPQDWVDLAAVLTEPEKANDLQCSKAIIDYLGADKTAAPANMLAGYGVAKGARQTFPTEPNSYTYMLSLLCVFAGLQSQASPANFRKPIVMLMLGDFGAQYWQTLIAMANGTFNFDPPAEEDDLLAEYYSSAARQLITQYAQQLATYGAAAGISYSYCGQNGDDATTLEGKLAALQNGQILIVNIPSTPPLVFNLLMASCTLPYIFEGQGTAILALNLGTPFLKMAKFAERRDYQDVVYNLPMMPPLKTKVSAKMIKAIRNLCIQDSAVTINNRLADLYTVMDSALSGQGAVVNYFKLLRRFYHNNAFDKLVLGTRYYTSTLAEEFVEQPVRTAQASDIYPNLRPVPEGRNNDIVPPWYGDLDPTNPLDQLYLSIINNTSNGTLNLYPGAIPADGSDIATFLQSLLGIANILTIEGVNKPPPPGTSITLTGTCNYFGTMPDDIKVVFTLGSDGKTLVMDLIASDPLLQWSGAPWFSIADPYMGILVSNGGIMSLGQFGGQVKIGEITVSIDATLPTSDSMILTATFPEVGPSLDSVFQFIGGVNLTSYIPPPLNTLVDLELQSVSFSYDMSTNAVDAMTVQLQSTPDWTLFGDLTLETLNFACTVVDPVGDREVSWEAYGTFSLPPGTLEFGVSYPNYAVAGGLADGSPPIPLSNIVAFFIGGIEVPISGELTSFSMLVTPATVTTYSIDMAVEGDWALPSVESAIFTVTELGFGISGSSDSSDSSNSFVTGYITGTIEMFASDPTLMFALTVTSTYGEDGSWDIVGQQSDAPIKVTDIIKAYLPASWLTDSLPEVQVSNLHVEINTGSAKTNAFYIIGGTVTVWDIPFITGPVTATAEIGDTLGTPTQPQTKFPFGDIEASLQWYGIDIKIGYDYNPSVTSYTLEWNGLIATVSEQVIDGKTHWISTLTFSSTTTLGGMIEQAISWATGTPYGLASPWNLLNDISLSAFSLTYDFTANTVNFAVNVGPIDLGFCRIDSIGVTYNSSDTGTGGVQIAISGSFPWNTGAEASNLSWDATKPETTPAPPGGGNKYFDLRLLAMGQHINVAGVAEAQTVEAAILAMSSLEPPSSGEMPSVTFDASNAWMTGLDVGILGLEGGGYCITGQVVFDDPDLYGLRLKLEGPPAKIFGGLDFEIMYRKISDTLGVYQAELTLPTSMRTIQTGIYTIQLPVFAIEVYTNGDFQIDVGFPWNEDFTRSFTVQAIIYPGIPLMGSGGFYFGKLSSASSNQVPVVSNGTFNPVIVFGFGAQVGFGKSVSYGPLSASFSLTVLGIIQGVIARWCPFEAGNSGNSTPSQLDGQYYFSITGTFGISGILAGSIDFAIIKASVNISLLVIAQIVFTSYEPIVLTVAAYVDVSASVKINLGFFSIKFSFHFSLSIRESFTIGSQGSPPWNVVGSTSTGRLDGPLYLRHTPTRRALLAAQGKEHLLQTVAAGPTWTNLAAATTKLQLTGYYSLALTAAGDEATTLSQQIPCYVAILAVDAPAPATTESLAASRVQATSDTSFEALCKLVTRWVIAAFQLNVQQPLTEAQVDALIISSDDLDAIFAWLADTTNPVPIPTSVIEEMLAQQVLMTIIGPDSGTADVQGAFFPMPLELQLDVPSYQGSTAYQYTFAGYNTLSSTAISDLETYFNQLAIEVEKETSDKVQAKAVQENEPLSVGGFVFADYFLLMARQMIQALQDSLKDFLYPLTPGLTPTVVVGNVNTTAGLSGTEQVTVSDLFTANQDKALTASKTVTITAATYIVQSGDTFQSIATSTRFGGAFTATEFATLNSSSTTLLQQATSVTVGGSTYIVRGGDSLVDVASGLGMTLEALLSDATVLNLSGLLMAYAVADLPDYTHSTSSGETLLQIATANGVTPAILGTSTNNGLVVDLFDTTTVTDLDISHLPQYQVGALLAETQRTPAITHLSSMISRFHFQGLRLPTSGITPNAKGMWVTDSMTLPAVAGLYALTGQQFPIPTITSAATYTVNLRNPSSISWVTYKNGTAVITVPISTGSPECNSIQALTSYVQSTRLVTGYTELQGQSTVLQSAASYSFGSYIPWLSPALPTLPYGSAVVGATQATLWKFPTALQSQLDRLTHKVNPCFLPQVQTYDDTTGETVSVDVANYGWATALEFTIKQVPPNANSPASATTYEIVSVGAEDTVLLEDIVSQFGSGSTMLQCIWIGYPPVGGIGSNGIQVGSSSTVFGISQVNLSTVTNPGLSATAAPQARTTTLQAGALNGNAAFLRLLWEAAITADGGYYLYYSDQGEGLPGTAFNSSGEAILSLVVLYAPDVSPAPANQIFDCMNSLILTDPIQGSAALVAVAQPNTVTQATNAEDSISSLVGAYYADIGDFAETNSGLTLKSGTSLTLTQGVYMVSPLGTAPGGLLANIATYFGMDATAIQNANPNIPSAEWGAALPSYTAIRLPVTTLVVGTSPGGSTLSSICTYYGCDLTGFATDNQYVVGVFALNQTLNIEVGPTSRSSNVPLGSQLLELQRPIPPDDYSTPQNLMLNQFSLLGYQIAANQDYNVSNLGVPVGPTGAEGDGAGKMRVARMMAADDLWSYDVTLAYLSQLSHPTGTGPYSGNGTLLQVDFFWLDLYGNTIISDLSTPAAGDSSPLNMSPDLVGYTDSLIGVGKWPSCSTSWSVVPGTSPAPPQILIPISFDKSRYIYSDTNPMWQANAASDLVIYQELADQLADPNGIAFSIETSLVSTSIPVSATNVSNLVAWVSTIVEFLTAQASGGSGTAPVPVYPISENIPVSSLNTSQIFELVCSLTMIRPGGIVEGEYSVLGGMRYDTTALSPSGATGSTGMTQFAEDFQTAFLTAGVNQLQVDLGIDRFQGGSATAQTLWAVWLGLEASQGINFSVDPKTNPPYIYAPCPISTSLQSRSGVPIYGYTSGKVINLQTPTTYQDFSNIDLDQWVRTIFASVDGVLTPEFISSILVVDAISSGSYMSGLQANKTQLAQMYSAQMVPVFVDQASAPTETIQEAFSQQLLSQLGNAYATQAALQYAANIVAQSVPSGETAPNFYGNISQTTSTVNVTFTPVKMPIAPATGTPLPILITTPNQTTGFTESSFITVDLAYSVTNIEHQIGSVPGIEGYLASTWLTPALPQTGAIGTPGSLSASLGSVEVPMALRSYPANPSLNQQSGTETDPLATDIADLTQWTYAIDYSMPFHYPQDVIYWTVLFNVGLSQVNKLASFLDSFNAMAEFVTVYPAVQADLVACLAQITAETTDPTLIANAEAALESLILLLDYITGLNNTVSSPGNEPSRAFSVRPRVTSPASGTPFEFNLQESSGPAGGIQNALIIALNVTTTPFDADSAPQLGVLIPSYTMKTLSSSGNTFEYYYVDGLGSTLTADQGQLIPDRTITMAGLQILDNQNALASAYVTRNQILVPGRTTSESFIYQTPTLSFTDVLQPTITSSQTIDIAMIGSQNGLPVQRSLNDQLTALFEALAQETSQTTMTVQIACFYQYTLNQQVGTSALGVTLPVLSQPPLNITLVGTPPSGGITLAQATTDLSTAISTWFGTTSPSTTGASLTFSLTVLTNEAGSGKLMPLLTLQDLDLLLSDIVPPLT